MSKSKTGHEKVTAAERRAKALELRKLGFTFKKIGEQLGITEAGAHKTVTAALRQLDEKISENATEVRRLELERLDDWSVRVAKEFQSGNALAAIDRGLKIQARRAKLLGLDAPTQFELAQIYNQLVNTLILEAQAGDSTAIEEVRYLQDNQMEILPAFLRWLESTRRPVTCTDSDVAKMTSEELVKAAQGRLTPHLLREIRERA